MYNKDLPRRADLPTTARLIRSTILAILSAIAILVVLVLPAEYGVDPTGLGRTLGLTQIGELKVQLAREAEQDRQTAAVTGTSPLEVTTPVEAERPDAVAQKEPRVTTSDDQPDDIAAVIETRTPQPAPEVAVEPAETAPVAAEPVSEWRDEITITLSPGQGIEYKLVMNAEAEAEYHWTANGSVLNFDTHGDGGGNSVSYEKGRGVAEDEGVIKAAFDGNHGWFWRNRTDSDVVLTLRTKGNYSELKRTV